MIAAGCALCLWQIQRFRRAVGWSSEPMLLWIMTIATYWMPLSFAYNLIFLPLLVMCLWDRREPGWLQVLVVSSLLPWWLPFGSTEVDWVLLRNVLKIIALYVLTLLMIRSFRCPATG